MHYTYLVETVNNTLYCGYTNNLVKRMKAHATNKSCAYIRSHNFKSFYVAFSFETKKEAMSCEYWIKQLSRTQKLDLINLQGPLIICDKIFNYLEIYKTIPNE